MWGVILFSIAALSFFLGLIHADWSGVSLFFTEACCSIGVIFFCLKEKNWLNKLSRRYFIFAITFLGFADLTYGIVRLGILSSGWIEALSHFSEPAYSCGAISMCLFFASGISKKKEKIAEDLPILFGSFLLFATLDSIYVLYPYFSRPRPVEWFYGANSVLFAIASSICFSLGMTLSIRVTHLKEFVVCMIFVLFQLAGIAIGYADSTVPTAAQAPQYLVNHEAVWALGYLLLLLAFVLPSSSESQFWASGRSRNNSLRTTITYRIVGLNVLILAFLTIFGAIQVKSALTISSSLYGFFGIWLISNLIAINFTKELNRVLSKITKNNASLARESTAVLQVVPVQKGFYEVDSILHAYNQTIHHSNEKIAWISKIEEEKQLAETVAGLARQVSHDIRSPLSALELVSSNLSEVLPEKRIIIRNSVNRIRDIANTLLKKGTHSSLTSESMDSAQNSLLYPIIESVVSEKMVQFGNRLGLEIELRQSQDSFGIFSRIQVTEFKRALSNLIDNSSEAMTGGSGKITINLEARSDDSAVIQIQDNGSGIPKDRIPLLGIKGNTFGKTGGNGLGLHHALNLLKGWGGDLGIQSELGSGTIVTLQLKKEPAPEWFAARINLSEVSRCVILDDDRSVHQAWEERLKESSANQKSVSILHFSDTESLRKFIREDSDLTDSTLFLIDYEIIGERTSGLDLIEETGINHESILVTSYFDEPSIKDRCALGGIKLLPKSMMGFVPVG